MLRRVREGSGWKAGAPGTAVALLKDTEFCCLFASYSYLRFYFLISSFLLVLGKADAGNDPSVMDKIFMLWRWWERIRDSQMVGGNRNRMA